MRRLAGTVLLVGAALASHPVRGQDVLGKKAYKFVLEDIDGKRVTRDDLKGKVVVLDFWAVWCGPCEVSLPFFQSLADKYGSKGLAVVGLHVDDRRPAVEEIREYLDTRKVRYTNLLSTYEVDEAFLIYAMPTTYVMDQEGRIQKRHVGFSLATTPQALERDIVEMLARR